jgi:hypothetical protein
VHTFVGGTLIVTIPCTDGIVVCADRLVTSKNETAESRSTETKITAIGKNGLFGVAGTVAATNPDGRRVYNVRHELDHYLRTVDARTLDQRISQLTDLVGNMMKSLTARAAPGFVPPGYQPGSDFFTVKMWRRDLEKKIKGYILRAKFDWGNTRAGSVEIYPTVSERLAIATPLSIGADQPLNELRLGGDPQFDSFRSDADIAALYGDPPLPASQLTLAEAQRLSKKLMAVAIRMIEIKGVPQNIGTRTDGALLSYADGYADLWRDEESSL